MSSTFRLIVREPGINVVIVLNAEDEATARAKLQRIIAQAEFSTRESPTAFGTSPSDAPSICSVCPAPAVAPGRCLRHLHNKPTN